MMGKASIQPISQPTVTVPAKPPAREPVPGTSHFTDERDKFALGALQGLIARPDGRDLLQAPAAAKLAYQYADAMLAERSKQKIPPHQ